MSESEHEGSRVLIRVVSTDGREIAWRDSIPEQLQDRSADIKAGVQAATSVVADSVTELPERSGWRLDEVTASFGITLTAEAGVLISKVSAGATLEVALTIKRNAGRRDDD